jgi:hypothetical protein
MGVEQRSVAVKQPVCRPDVSNRVWCWHIGNIRCTAKIRQQPGVKRTNTERRSRDWPDCHRRNTPGAEPGSSVLLRPNAEAELLRPIVIHNDGAGAGQRRSGSSPVWPMPTSTRHHPPADRQSQSTRRALAWGSRRPVSVRAAANTPRAASASCLGESRTLVANAALASSLKWSRRPPSSLQIACIARSVGSPISS